MIRMSKYNHINLQLKDRYCAKMRFFSMVFRSDAATSVFFWYFLQPILCRYTARVFLIHNSFFTIHNSQFTIHKFPTSPERAKSCNEVVKPLEVAKPPRW
jgi:hypothetical protein